MTHSSTCRSAVHIVRRILPLFLVIAVAVSLVAACDDGGKSEPDTAMDAFADGVDGAIDAGIDTRSTDTMESGRACGFESCAEGEACCQQEGVPTCVDTSTDAANCGACGVQCDATETCTDGVCRCGAPACADGEACCTRDDETLACIDVSSDSKHCGACGNACAGPESCVRGSCVCLAQDGVFESCGDDETCCPGFGCADLERHPLSCGACGLECGPGELCVNGACECGDTTANATGETACGEGSACCGSPATCVSEGDASCECGARDCVAGEQCCAGTDAEGNPIEACARIATDVENCGTCGTACGPSERCRSGSCLCEAGTADCDGDASNGCEATLRVDPDNCGGCGAACAGGEVCFRGLCAATCQIGAEPCDGGCFDITRTTRHCGACGNECESGFVCNGLGQCALECTSTTRLCRDGCFDLLRDHAHCGDCGIACERGLVCDGHGRCDVECQPGLTACGGSCYDLDRMWRHCGACGNTCPDGEVCNGTGQCELECLPDLTACDGNCVDLKTDYANCGACGAPCDGNQVCVAGTCVDAGCPSGLTDCDGACVDTASSSEHCGACGNPCSAVRVCSSGACQCLPPLSACGSSCADLTSDVGHCGACGNSCTAGETCVAGQCLPAGQCTDGRIECDGECVNPLGDPLNCGGCGQRCLGGQFCEGGSCVCAQGLADCTGDGICATSLGGDSENCGACGVTCDATEICDGGTCRCPDGFVDCDTDGTCETQIFAQEGSCGACGTSCAQVETCVAGGCVDFGRTRLATFSEEEKFGTSRNNDRFVTSAVACFIDGAGAVQCAGSGDLGWLGRGMDVPHADAFQPVQGLDGTTAAIDVTLGREFGCALLEDGSVWCWGSDGTGQLGDGGGGGASNAPVEVESIDGVTKTAVSVTAGEIHACALLDSGAVECWGRSSDGRLGNGCTDACPEQNVFAPVPVVGIDGVNQSATRVVAGFQHTCALLDSGAVWCWGRGAEGQFGNDVEPDRGTPAVTAGLDGTSASTRAVDIIAGRGNTCVILEDGGVTCWGWDEFGGAYYTLAATSSGVAASPTERQPLTPAGLPPGPTPQRFSRGTARTRCLTYDNGESWCWGGFLDCASGLAGFPGRDEINIIDHPPTQVSTEWVEVATSDAMTLARTRAGEIVALGSNYDGALGQLAAIPRLTPRRVVERGCDPGNVSSCGALTGVVDIAVGPMACAVAQSGELDCWGANGHQDGASPVLLGQGTIEDFWQSSTPLHLDSISDVVQTAVGYRHGCARTTTGTVHCWGMRPMRGEAATGASGPVYLIAGLDGTGALAVDVAAGANNSCAALDDGTVLCWGDNSDGQLGTDPGTLAQSETPVAIPGFGPGETVAVDVECGPGFVCARDDADGVWCWGRGDERVLGINGSTSGSTTPVQIVDDVGNPLRATDLGAGQDHACIVSSAGAVICWGGNDNEALGRVDPGAWFPTPAPVDGLDGTTETAVAVDAGMDAGCAVLASGAVKCWGRARDDLDYRSTAPAEIPGLDGTTMSAVDVAIAAYDAEPDAGRDNGSSANVCALLDDGTVACWGENRQAGVGDGAMLERCTPIELRGNP